MFFKPNTLFSFVFAVFLCLVLAACSPTSPLQATLQATVQPTTLPSTAAPTDTPTSAPAPLSTATMQTYTSPDFGYSLSYPDGYDLQQNYQHEIILMTQSTTTGHRERASLQVEMAGGHTADWFATHVQEENASLNPNMTASTIEIDGQPAYVLDQVPGQDLNRQVFVINKDILYHLTFMPAHPDEGEAYQQMETLYAAVLETLRFQPQHRGVPPVSLQFNILDQLEAASEARNADAVMRTLGEKFTIWYQRSQGLDFEELGQSDAAQAVLNKLSQSPDLLILQSDLDWPALMGSAQPFSGLFPEENITPVLVQGWGLQGSDDAVIFLARRLDGSLYWRGMFIPLEKLTP